MRPQLPTLSVFWDTSGIAVLVWEKEGIRLRNWSRIA